MLSRASTKQSPLGDLDINRAIVPDTPIDPENLTNAKTVAKKLKATISFLSNWTFTYFVESPVNPGVTDDMVQSAELRLRAIEGAHTAAIYAPGLMMGIAAILQRLGAIEGRFGTIEGRFDTIEGRLGTLEGRVDTIRDDVLLNKAMTLNHRTIARNQLTQPNCQPLRKTVVGHGFDLVITLTRQIDRRGLVAPAQAASIGAIPPNFNVNITGYTTKEIAKLVLFYNEDFGIVVDDDEGARRVKIIRFLSRY